jgi:hypothetical protein
MFYTSKATRIWIFQLQFPAECIDSEIITTDIIKNEVPDFSFQFEIPYNW